MPSIRSLLLSIQGQHARMHSKGVCECVNEVVWLCVCLVFYCAKFQGNISLSCTEAVWVVLDAEASVCGSESGSVPCVCEILCRQPASARCRSIFLESQPPFLLSGLTGLEELQLSPSCSIARMFKHPVALYYN